MDTTSRGLWLGIFIILKCLLVPSLAESVLFPSGYSLTTEDDLSFLADPSIVDDPKNTGSKLFRWQTIVQKTLSLNVRVEDIKSDTVLVFRAHPLFIECLQKIISRFRAMEPPLKLIFMSAYLSGIGESGNSTKAQDLYARGGTAAQLAFHYADRDNGDLLDIAKAALQLCPVMFERNQRDIGVIMMSDRVHIHMSGSDDTEPLFDVDGYTEMVASVFRSWAFEKMSEGLDPAQTPDCSRFSEVTNGNKYPASAVSPEAAVGALDEPITRNDTEDFKKLVQYQGDNIVFEDSEGSAAWCGADGVPCNPCSVHVKGNALSSRCADRTMSTRMYLVLRKLQKAARIKFSGNKIKVLEAWDEPYDGQAGGDNPAGSLHFEGRAVQLQLASSNSDSNLQGLSQLAICFGADYVEHKGTHLLLAVRKMKGYEEKKVQFPSIDLLCVDPPFSKWDDYKLPELFSESEQDEYPLFDTLERGDVVLADGATISQFASDDPDFRYMRASPRIIKCYSDIVYHENKWNKDGDPQVEVEVVTGFLSNPQQRSMFEPLMDPRYNTHTLGTAMYIKYADGSNADRTIYTLLDSVIVKCAPVFDKDEQQLALGIYSDSIYVDIRDEFEVWVYDESLIPDGKDIDTYHDELKLRSVQAIENRIVDPDDIDEACVLAHPPSRQDTNYTFSHPETVLRRRRAVGDEQCVPQTDTSFCTSTKKNREKEVELMWTEIMRKPRYHDETELKAALVGCFDNCGTCLEGAVWEDKTEHCSKFLHWANFDLMNDASPDITNLYSKNNLVTRPFACSSGQHCLDHAPLFAQLAPSVNRIYRPDPKKSVKEELYSSEDNPLPVTQLLDKLYGIHAKGLVKMWVVDETEMTSMKEALMVPMLYNKDVTKIEIYVTNEISLEAVDSVVQNFATEWTTTGCLLYTRSALAPFEILTVPHQLKKRSAETPNMGADMRRERLHYDDKWLHEDL